MNILLIYPNITDYPIDISYGLASISANLKKHGHVVELIDFTFGSGTKELQNKVRTFNPGLIGIPVASNDFLFCKQLISAVKEVADIPILAGSYHATLAPDDVLQKTKVDWVIIGEGEFTVLKLIRYLEDPQKADLSEIEGLAYKSNNQVIVNKIGCLNQNPDILPFPDKELFDYQRYIDLNRGLGTFITSFGCPFSCTYCINKALINKYGRQGFVRFKSVDYLLKEIKHVIQSFKVRELEFYDDTFTLDRRRLEIFCKRYPKEIGLPFYINSRVDTIKSEEFVMLRDAGCQRVSLGLECGDPEIRNKLLKRNQTDEQILRTFEAARKAGIQTLSYNMVGIPYETEESIKKTILLNRKCRPDFVAVSIFNAYQGTEIYDLCKENGWLSHERGLSYFQTSNINHPNFSVKRLKQIRDSFGYEVFKHYNRKRAYIDLIDKKLIENRLYQTTRSFLIRSGVKKIIS